MLSVFGAMFAPDQPRAASELARVCRPGGLIGLAAASFLTAITISTTNFQSFSELAFAFTLTPGIVAAALIFSVVMGFVGGFLPAIKASRMKIVDALRAD